MNEEWDKANVKETEVLKKRLEKVLKKIQQLDGRLGEVDENIYNVV